MQVRALARINVAAIERNSARLVRSSPRLCAVVKANGYGHGAVECSRHLAEESVRIIRVLFRLATPFWMSVQMVLRRKDRRGVGRVRMDVKDAGLFVIDPDDGVSRHDFSSD